MTRAPVKKPIARTKKGRTASTVPVTPAAAESTVHTSRTIMLADLTQLLVAPPDALRAAVVEENVLGKRTPRTRVASWKYLNTLYDLTGDDLVRSGFLSLWHAFPEAQPHLALVRALERDALLRRSAPWIMALPEGAPVRWADLAEGFTRQGVQYSPKTLGSLARNLLSSWAQAGWLRGKIAKTRAPSSWHPAAIAYLLRRQYEAGARGAALFDLPLAPVLGVSAAQLDGLAYAAAQERLLTYRRLADVVEITFGPVDA